MRILFVTARPPWPSRRGDQARVAGWVRELAGRHVVSVVCQRPPRFPATSFPAGVRGREIEHSWRRADRLLHRAIDLPLQVALHVQPRLARAVAREVIDFEPDVAVVTLSRLGWLLPALERVPVALDLVDSLALNMRRRAARQPGLAALWRWEARRIDVWERRLATRVALAAVVSRRDRDALLGDGEAPPGRVEVLPFGISMRSELPPRGAEPVVVLSGNLGYFPTRDGALWLAREVWPRIRRACPQARWWLAGSRIPPALRRLSRLPGVEILEEPEDLSAVRRRAAVAVAPMRAGSGTPIKVLEAMADGLPVVATPEAAAGLDGLQGNEVRIDADPGAFAASVARLLDDRAAADAQAAAAWTWLRERHDLGRVARRFESLLKTIAGPPPAPR